jgi:hypothetical protein
MALLRQFASANGDGTGTTTAASDSSMTALELAVTPASAQEYRIDQLVVFIEDNAALLGDVFGSAALTNGIRIQVLNGADVSLLDIDAGVPIKRLADLWALGAEQLADPVQAAAGTNKYAALSLKFAQPIVLNGNTPSRLAITFEDNLANLVLLKVMAVGIKRGQLVA